MTDGERAAARRAQTRAVRHFALVFSAPVGMIHRNENGVGRDGSTALV
jgi:hypothetical protein